MSAYLPMTKDQAIMCDGVPGVSHSEKKVFRNLVIAVNDLNRNWKIVIFIALLLFII